MDDRYPTRRRGSGCFGCLATVVLIIAIACAGAVAFGPPIAKSIVGSFARRTQNLAEGVLSDVTGEEKPSTDTDLSGVGYVGQHLPENQQKAYAQLLDHVTKLEESFTIYDVDASDIDPAFRAMMADHPEIFWLDGSLTYTYSQLGQVVLATPGLAMSMDMVPGAITLVENDAKPFLDSIVEGASEYDKARAAYEYIISSCDYNLEAEHSQSIFSVFVNKSSVCAGYTKAYQYLLQKMGMFCAYVEGTISTTGEDHAWNLVSIDGQYAYVDVTWGDPAYLNDDSLASAAGVIYDYLFLTTDEILADHHVFTNPDIWPPCNATDLDYYKRNGRFFDTYDEQALADVLKADIEQGSRMCGFKFSNDEAFQAARTSIESTPTLLVTTLSLHTDATTYSYTVSDSLRIIKLYW